MRRMALVCTVTGLLLAAPVEGTVLYVDTDATGPTHDGSSWCNAFLYVQDALSAAAFN